MSDRLISAGFGPISMPQAVPAASSEAAHGMWLSLSTGPAKLSFRQHSRRRPLNRLSRRRTGLASREAAPGAGGVPWNPCEKGPHWASRLCGTSRAGLAARGLARRCHVFWFSALSGFLQQ